MIVLFVARWNAKSNRARARMVAHDARTWYTAAMKFRRALFWDTNPQWVNPKKHATYIIERIADFGTAAEIRWAIRRYGLRRFREVVRRSRVTLEPTKRLWLDVLGRKPPTR
jgi:hypothetical protein